MAGVTVRGPFDGANMPPVPAALTSNSPGPTLAGITRAPEIAPDPVAVNVPNKKISGGAVVVVEGRVANVEELAMVVEVLEVTIVEAGSVVLEVELEVVVGPVVDVVLDVDVLLGAVVDVVLDVDVVVVDSSAPAGALSVDFPIRRQRTRTAPSFAPGFTFRFGLLWWWGMGIVPPSYCRTSRPLARLAVARFLACRFYICRSTSSANRRLRSFLIDTGSILNRPAAAYKANMNVT